VTTGAADAVLTATGVGWVPVTAAAGVIGLLVGSFLNVVIYRVPRGLSVVEPRSFCPHCDTPVGSLDNVPVVSWIVLGGRCRHCRGPISMRYPLVELGTGIAFAAVGWALGPHWAVAGFCVLAATALALVAVEQDGLGPPLSVAAVGTALGTALLLGAGVADQRWAHVVGMVIGVAVATALVGFTRRRHNAQVEPRSWADAGPVLLPVGAALGWLGPLAAVEGLGTTVVVLAVDRVVRDRRSTTSSDAGPSVVGFALAAGVVVATIIAVAVSGGVGR
jgi:leader peptidase (prepilin peptidase)/N-methyltransferase